MKKLTLVLAIIMMASCAPTQQAVKNQMESVSLNKKEAKGLKKASYSVNKRLSETGHY